MNSQAYKIFTLIAVLGVWSLTSCQKDPNDPGTEFAPQMYVSKPYEPYTQVKPNPLNPKGLNLRNPVKNTIPRRKFSPEFELTDSLGNTVKKVDIMYYDIPRDDAGRELASKILRNPIPITKKSLAEGKVLYERFCASCHGAGGAADGKVAEKYNGVANLTGAAYNQLSGGHIFHVITNGKGLMWPHGSQLNADERWKVVHYVHQLMGQIPADLAELDKPKAESADADSTQASTTTTETE